MTALTMTAHDARVALEEVYARMRAMGCAAPHDVSGQLIRPLLSVAGARALGIAEDDRFWSAAAAVQLAHEASLVHDDVIDHATHRRGEPTLSASRGVAAALVEGDHLLTTAYRLAADAEQPMFFVLFARAVERTVAGEKQQGRAAGVLLDERRYREIVAGKSGELLGCALAAAALVRKDRRAEELVELGRGIGTLYQMLDDLLDYCPAADCGKPSLGDFRQRRWTWPLLGLSHFSWDDDAEHIAARFATADALGVTPLRWCLERLQVEAGRVRAEISACMPGDTLVRDVVAGWMLRAREAVEAVEAAAEVHRVQRLLESRLPHAADMHAFFAQNSRSFSFAARLFPRDLRDRVAGVYAFCRATDDIADGDMPLDDRIRCLDIWQAMSALAYDGVRVGQPVLETVMCDAARSGVPFRYVEELIEGMRMDLRGETYDTLDDLRIYSYRVAGVIGQWLTRLCGVHDPAVLVRAASLGHAMQLTNIIRDVGEDLRHGRVYIPAQELGIHGLTRADLNAFAAGVPHTVAYTQLLEGLMRHAERDYEQAMEATPALPASFRHAVVVAAHVYRGIHDVLRSHRYDNIHTRAVTSTATKVYLAARALLKLPHMRRGAGSATQARHARGALTMLALVSAGAVAPKPVVAQTAVRAQTAAHGQASVRAQSAAHAQPTPSAQVRLRAEAALAVAAAPADPGARLDLVRALFFVAVDDEDAVPAGHAAIPAVERASPGFARAHRARLLAYEGAFTALEAKHGKWPPSRLRAVRRGLARLDSAVALAPADAEIRYLRMVNSFYLPGLFGRRDAVANDMKVLAQLLPGARTSYPGSLHRTMIDFVLRHGGLTAEAERKLQVAEAEDAVR